MKSAYDKALDILNRVSKTEYSLRIRLKDLGYSSKNIDEALDSLSELGYINDDLYLENFVDEAIIKKHGRLRIRRDLNKVGFDNDRIENILFKKLPLEIEEKNAQDVYEGILESATRQGLEKEKLYRRVASKLNTLGYESELIYEISSQVNDL